MTLIDILLRWSEVWALLIPLIVILVFRPKGRIVSWLIVYVIFAFLFNTIAITMIEDYTLLPSFLALDEGNNLYYNLHSLLMVICFSGYIISVRTYQYPKFLKGLLIAYILFVPINFIFVERVLFLSTLHFTVGSIVLIFICLFYFFRSILDDENATDWLKHPSFLICSGLSLYQVITFFIFLFIYPIYNKNINKDMEFADAMMYVYQGIFVIFCILLAIGLYRHSRLNKKGAA